MMGIFSNSLMQFALAVDIVNEDDLHEVMRLIREYVREALHMETCVLFSRHQVGREPGLISIWNSAGYSWSRALKDRNGNHSGQVSFAYSRRKPLWIVSKDREPLEETTAGYVDCFQHAEPEEIPKYVPAGDTPIRTSVYLPLVVDTFDEQSRFASRNSEIMGILNFESPEYIECTPALETDVVAISEALSLIYKMMETHSVQSRGTIRAKEALENVLRNNIEELRRKPLIGKQRLFLATPGESSDDVIGTIRHVLNEYDQLIDTYYWKQDAQAGNIHAKLWEEIQRSRCGIFYLSQLAKNGERYTYRDNPNVLFEAGMMYGLLGGNLTRSGLVLVREEDSPDIPFDILAERRLTVPRDRNGQLNKESFRTDLKAQLDQILYVVS